MQKLKRLERALVAGEWFQARKATQVWADIVIGAGMLIGAGATIYSANKQGQIANSQLGLEGAQNARQQQAFDQLQQLISNPGAFFDSPVYKAAAAQGSSAVARETGATYGPKSGNEAQALQAYGQSFGQQQLLSQEQLLAGMAGTGFNPAAAGQAASGAVNAGAGALSSLGGLLSFFGSGMGGGGSGVVNPDNLPINTGSQTIDMGGGYSPVTVPGG
jgi:hypothetical protein